MPDQKHTDKRDEPQQALSQSVLFCTKCASEDIRIVHVPRGKTVNSSAWNRVETDFLTSSEFDIYFRIDAKREHLNCRCRQCGYGWRQATVQNEKDIHE